MLRFVTTNEGKVREASEYLDEEVRQLALDQPEIQGESFQEIAAHAARSAYRAVEAPVIVDDSGLSVEALEGFPGPYSSYVEDTLGIERVWKLAEREDHQRAFFRTVLAYCDGEGFEAAPEPVDRTDRRGRDLAAEERASAITDEGVSDGEHPVKLFEGAVAGTIVAPRGTGGFGYDPIFEHDGTTFAEMDPEEKNAVSHRGRALAKFAEWYAGR